MSAREDARREMTHGHLYLDEDRANELLNAYRAEVLREALAAISGEQLSDRTGTPEDEAYDGGVRDAHRAVMALIYP